VRLEQALNALTRTAPEHRVNPSLDSFKQLLSVMGDPQLGVPSLIVGGTNGKTSTSRAIATLAETLGYLTGLFTSPHLFDVRERILVGLEMVTPDRLADALDRIADYADLLPPGIDRPTYFETLTAAAFEIFADEPVDLAVLEVGMGGKWDATNVTTPLAACLMPISLDHMEYLGDTVEEIATDKAHIIQPSSIAIVASQPADAMSAIKKRCNDLGCELLAEGVDFAITNWRSAVGGQIFDLRTPLTEYRELFLPLFGAHQASNVAVAVTALSVSLTAGEPPTQTQVEDALAQISSPGRLEVLSRDPLIIVDACHNPGGAEVTVRALSEAFASQEFILVFAVMKDKDALAILRQLAPVLKGVVVTSTNSPRSQSIGELNSLVSTNFSHLVVEAAENVSTACEVACAMATDRGQSTGVLVAGSVVLAGAARQWAQSG
jgi:dihydrofolate synthase/folylpolyglutamate synthase